MPVFRFSWTISDVYCYRIKKKNIVYKTETKKLKVEN